MKRLLLLLCLGCSVEAGSPTEALCGWVQTSETTLPPADGCWRLEPEANAAATLPGAHACDVERMTWIEAPGARLALWSRLGAMSETTVHFRKVGCQ